MLEPILTPFDPIVPGPIVQPFVHYFLHLGFPALLALGFFRDQWKKAYLILLATMLVDLDHLFANPIFQPDRCSIGFHPLHGFLAISLYPLLLALGKTARLVGIGLLLHMATDLIDCWFMFQLGSRCEARAAVCDLLAALSRCLGES